MGMAMGEGEIIERYFRHLGAVRTDVALGIGDDAALLRPAPGCELVQSTDALIEQVHFPAGSAPRSLGHRALAINLSDLAAMGATPAWALLSLTLPRPEEAWLGEFSRGFARLAREHEVALVGGNLSRGPLSITVQLTGQVPQGTAVRRSGGRAGDELWVSGTLGDAAQGLILRLAEGGAQALPPDAESYAAWLCARFEYPAPRVALGVGLRKLASACIDLSDGLLADLPRLAAASGCGAELEVDRLPLSPALRAVSGDSAWQQALAGGEDYELCFTASAAHAPQLQELAATLGVPLCCCGRLRDGSGVELRRAGTVIQFAHPPFDHFGA
jgi:thiamine-monophosphate kinase